MPMVAMRLPRKLDPSPYRPEQDSMTSGERSAILTRRTQGRSSTPMPLVLTLNEGEDFYIRDDRVVLEKIHSQTEFSLRRSRDNALIQNPGGASR